jgi:voltage-gated potassium channel
VAGERSTGERREDSAPVEVSTDEIHKERWELLEHVNALTEKPFIALSLLWVVLLILEFTSDLNRPLEVLTDVIWVLFILDFLIEFAIAPKKWDYLRGNWLTALSLALPAFRLLRIFQLFRAFRAFRFFRVVRVARSLRLLRLFTSLNRGMRATRNALGRHRVGYVLSLTTLVVFAGAAGMLRFENPASLMEAGIPAGERGSGLRSYSDALWWTAMLLTTLGSEYWPQTAEGRITCWLLSLYAFAIFGYITATIASYFIGKGSEAGQGAPEGEAADARPHPTEAQLNRALGENTALRAQVADLADHLRAGPAMNAGEGERSSGP